MVTHVLLTRMHKCLLKALQQPFCFLVLTSGIVRPVCLNSSCVLQSSLLLSLPCQHPGVDLESGRHDHTCHVSKDVLCNYCLLLKLRIIKSLKAVAGHIVHYPRS